MQCNNIVIVSDIHGDLNALKAVISYMEDNNISVALNLGDFISKGQNPCEVFDLIMGDKRFINIRGYDEEELLDKTKHVQKVNDKSVLIKQLGVDRINMLRQMPSYRMIKVNNKALLLCHHNGWAEILQAKAHSKLEGESYDLIAYGGSHMQELCHAKGPFYNTSIIDPGALQADKDSKGRFAIVNLESSEPGVNFCNIEIENVGTLEERKEDKQELNVEQQVLMKQTFLYIHGKKEYEHAIMYIENEVIDEVIRIGIRQCKYVCIGCWKYEKQIIRELLYYLKCRTVIYSEKDDQEWYIGEITKEVEDLLLKRRNFADGRMKWFEISFLNELDKSSTLYSVYHYGKEGFLKRLSEKELYNIETMLKRYDLPYYMPEEEKIKK